MKRIVLALGLLVVLLVIGVLLWPSRPPQQNAAPQLEADNSVKNPKVNPPTKRPAQPRTGDRKLPDDELIEWSSPHPDGPEDQEQPEEVPELAQKIFALAESDTATALIDRIARASANGGEDLWLAGWALVYKMTREEGAAAEVINELLRGAVGDEQARKNLFCLLGKVYNDRPEVMDFLLAQLASKDPLVPRRIVLMSFGQVRREEKDYPVREYILILGSTRAKEVEQFREFYPDYAFAVMPPRQVLDTLWNIPSAAVQVDRLDVLGAYQGILMSLDRDGPGRKPHPDAESIRRQTAAAIIRTLNGSEDASVWASGIGHLALAATAEGDAIVLDALSRHDSEYVRSQAAFWLGQRQSKSPAVQAALLKACSDAAWRVRAMAASQLAVDEQLKSTAVATLEHLFRQDESDYVRRDALTGLVRVLGEDASPYIEEARKSADELMRREAEQCATTLEFQRRIKLKQPPK